MPILALLAVGLVGVFAWFVAARRKSRSAEPAVRWRHTDTEPDAWRGHAKEPDRVDHEFDLETWRYRVVATWVNSEPYAESDQSIVTEDFEVRRLGPSDWQIRLIRRNGSTMTDQEWRDAPFPTAWEMLWVDRAVAEQRGSREVPARRG
jgi:hypothetical protein